MQTMQIQYQEQDEDGDYADDMWDKVGDTKNELMVEACDDLMSTYEEDEIEDSEEWDED